MLNKLLEHDLLLEKQNYEEMYSPWVKLLKSYENKAMYELDGEVFHFSSDSNFVELLGTIKEFNIYLAETKRKLNRSDYIRFSLTIHRVFIIGTALLTYWPFDWIIAANSGSPSVIEFSNQAYSIFEKYYSHLASIEKNQQTIRDVLDFIYNIKNKIFTRPSRQSYDFYNYMAHITDMNKTLGLLDGYNFQGKSITQVATELPLIEKRYAENTKGMLEEKLTDNWEIIMKFTDGFAWVDLHTSVSEDEAEMMGHCCTDPRTEDGGTVYSLRKITTLKNGKRLHNSHVTFMIKNKIGYEIKGRGNDKPVAKYHPYLVALLKSKYIVDIVGGGYMSENNFMISDLSENMKKDLYKSKPSIRPLEEIKKEYGKDSKIFDEKCKVLMDRFGNPYFVYIGNGMISDPSVEFSILDIPRNDAADFWIEVFQGDRHYEKDANYDISSYDWYDIRQTMEAYTIKEWVVFLNKTYSDDLKGSDYEDYEEGDWDYDEIFAFLKWVDAEFILSDLINAINGAYERAMERAAYKDFVSEIIDTLMSGLEVSLNGHNSYYQTADLDIRLGVKNENKEILTKDQVKNISPFDNKYFYIYNIETLIQLQDEARNFDSDTPYESFNIENGINMDEEYSVNIDVEEAREIFRENAPL